MSETVFSIPTQSNSAPEAPAAPAQGPEAKPAGPTDAAPPVEEQPAAPKADENSAIVAELARKYIESQAPKQEEQAPFQPPVYNLQVPEQIIGLLQSEDPSERAKGYGAFASAVANTVQKQIIDILNGHYTELFSQRMEEFYTQKFSAVEQERQAEQAAKNFYAKYPYLDNEAGKHLASGIAQQLLQEQQAKTGRPGVVNAALMEEVARRATMAIQQITGKPLGKPNGQFQLKGGARPNIQPAAEDALTSDILSLRM